MSKLPTETGTAFTSKHNQRYQIPDIEIKQINTPIKQDNAYIKPKQGKTKKDITRHYIETESRKRLTA